MAVSDLGKKVIQMFFIGFVKPLLLALCIIGIISCANNAERDAVCRQSDRWNSASTQAALALEEIGSIGPARLREIFAEIVQTLIFINESAPRELRDDSESLLNTYGALSDALAAIDWEGQLADKNSAVTSAGVRLASSNNQQAQANLADYFLDNCSVQIDNAVNKFPNVGTTLPDPVIQDEEIEPPSVGYDDDTSVVTAFGFVVVERFGVAITSEQANCVGSALMSANKNNVNMIDETYWDVLQVIFDECKVNINIEEALANE